MGSIGSSGLCCEWALDRRIKSTGVPGCGSSTVTCSGGCTLYAANDGGFVTGTSGDENRNRKQRETKRCQIVEEAECWAKDLVSTLRGHGEPPKNLTRGVDLW